MDKLWTKETQAKIDQTIALGKKLKAKLRLGEPLLPINFPEFGKPVNAVLKWSGKWKFITDVTLVAVDESDCNWRDEDGNELSYGVDVVYWEYKKERPQTKEVE